MPKEVPPRNFTIKNSWVDAFPSRRMDAKFWNLIVKAMDELGINKDTAGRDECRRAAELVKRQMGEKLAKIKKLRQKAEQIRATARAMEENLPDVEWMKIDESDYEHPHMRGEPEWFRWMYGTCWFNVDQARKMIESGEVKAEKSTVPVKNCYALLGLDQSEFGSKDFTDDWEAGRGINMMSAITQRKHMQGMPDEKYNEPAIIVMWRSQDAMKRAGVKLPKKALEVEDKAFPVIVDGNHRLGRMYLEGVETAYVYVVQYEEALKFAYDGNHQPMLKAK